MKRILLLSILLVLLAAVINIMVALGLWRYGIPSNNNFFVNTEIEIGLQEVADWRKMRQSDWPLNPESANKYTNFGVTLRSLSWKDEEWSGLRGDVNFKIIKLDTNLVFINEFGWPLRCIAEERWYESRQPNGSYQSSKMISVFGVPAPNRVLWLGMFINVLYYCLSIALVILCWKYTRRGLRRQFGRCIKCGYDLRGGSNAGCPECGWGRETV